MSEELPDVIHVSESGMWFAVHPMPDDTTYHHQRVIDAKDARIKELEDVLREADEYLKPNPKNSIGTGSILHRKMVDALLGDETR